MAGPALKDYGKRLPPSVPPKQPKVPELSPTAASRAAAKPGKAAPSPADAQQVRAAFTGQPEPEGDCGIEWTQRWC